MTVTAAPAVHAKTGLPIQPTATFAVGDLVTESLMGDGSPAVVVHVAASGKTVYTRPVRFILGNVSEQDVPGHNGYGDSATLVIDPLSVEEALAAGLEHEDGRAGKPVKWVLRVSAQPRRAHSINEREAVGPMLHNAAWKRPGFAYGSLSQGASYRRDPHV